MAVVTEAAAAAAPVGGKGVRERSAARIWVCRKSNSSTSGNVGSVTEKGGRKESSLQVQDVS